MFERDALIVHIIQHGYYLVPFLDGGMFQLPKFELESAWVDTAIKDECVWLVERYAPEGHKKALKFLLSRDLQQYGDLDFHSAILRIDPKNGPELILDRILKTQNTAKPRWYGYYALNVIHKMPLSALPKIEAFGEKLKADYREYFDRILAEYRMNNAKP